MHISNINELKTRSKFCSAVVCVQTMIAISHNVRFALKIETKKATHSTHRAKHIAINMRTMQSFYSK